MSRENRGQIRIIEAFLAVLIVFSSLAVSSSLTVTEDAGRRNDLTVVGWQALTKLDSDGSLSRYVENGNWAGLRDAVNLVLPSGVTFNLTVLDNQMNQINAEAVSNGGFGSQDIAFVEYPCASRGPSFRCYIVHLRLAVAT